MSRFPPEQALFHTIHSRTRFCILNRDKLGKKLSIRLPMKPYPCGDFGYFDSPRASVKSAVTVCG
jgi:hypothetical protein